MLIGQTSCLMSAAWEGHYELKVSNSAAVTVTPVKTTDLIKNLNTENPEYSNHITVCDLSSVSVYLNFCSLAPPCYLQESM